MSIASNYALRLPASLKRELEKVAREDGTSLNQFIVGAVAEKLAALRTADFFEERRARANVEVALASMSRKRGEAPSDADALETKALTESPLPPKWRNKQYTRATCSVIS